MICSPPPDELSVALSRFFQDKSAVVYKIDYPARTTKPVENLPLGNRLVSYDELMKIKQFPIFNLGQFRGGLIVNEKTKGFIRTAG